MSSPSFLPPSHLSKCSLHCTAASHSLSILHMVVYICQSNLAVRAPHSYTPTHAYMSILFVSIFIPVMQIVSSVLLF